LPVGTRFVDDDESNGRRVDFVFAFHILKLRCFEIDRCPNSTILLRMSGMPVHR
jgi:hypothetical protein